jgi:DNA-binding response OmpR family regulator
VKRILLAEDEAILRMLILDTLEEKDYVVDEAEDGLAALNYIKDKDYDLIIIDYMMPEYTGLEVIEKVRSEMGMQEAKIMMLSAKCQQFEQEKVLAAGANYFMSKPFSPIELLKRIEEILDED